MLEEFRELILKETLKDDEKKKLRVLRKLVTKRCLTWQREEDPRP